MGRYALPCWVRSVYYAARYRCLVSLRADIQLSSRIRFGKGTDIRPYARMVTSTGAIVLGRRCGIGSFAYLATGKASILVGDYVRIGAHTYIGASNRGFDNPNKLIIEHEKTEQGITIEEDVWIGANCVILDGVRIGRGSVVGAGAVVTRDVPSLSIAVGNPARVIRKRGEKTGTQHGPSAGQATDADTHANELILPAQGWT